MRDPEQIAADCVAFADGVAKDRGGEGGLTRTLREAAEALRLGEGPHNVADLYEIKAERDALIAYVRDYRDGHGDWFDLPERVRQQIEKGEQ